MPKEFMLYIRNSGPAKALLPAASHLEFVKSCEEYIHELRTGGHLIAAQPILHEGCIISQRNREWVITPVDPENEMQVGYYHIYANDLEEAIRLAKKNPEFKYIPTATIEVRPVKTKEELTNFNYPTLQPPSE